jgi:chromosome segregation ATPase
MHPAHLHDAVASCRERLAKELAAAQAGGDSARSQLDTMQEELNKTTAVVREQDSQLRALQAQAQEAQLALAKWVVRLGDAGCVAGQGTLSDRL